MCNSQLTVISDVEFTPIIEMAWYVQTINKVRWLRWYVQTIDS